MNNGGAAAAHPAQRRQEAAHLCAELLTSERCRCEPTGPIDKLIDQQTEPLFSD